MTLSIFQNEKGFVALISVVLLSAMMLVLAVAASRGALAARFNALAYENKRISFALAESCADAARANMAKNQNYGAVIAPGGDSVDVGVGANCKICAVVFDGAAYRIFTRAGFGGAGNYSRAYTNLRTDVILQSGYFKIISWEETAESAYAGGCAIP